METVSHSRALLEKMNNAWQKRSQVKKKEIDTHLLLDVNKPDFLSDLLPFKNHPAFLRTSEEMKNKILSCGWLIYNWKTIAIELKVVNPVCEDIIYHLLPGVNDAIIQEVATDTLVDESYHVQLVNKACSITREQRKLNHLKCPEFNLIRNMKLEQALYSEDWQKLLIKLATSVVSEVFVSDYLKLLSTDTTIQPFNRTVVETHHRDENAHGCIFKNLIKCIYFELTTEQKEFLIKVLPKPVYWFADHELEIWHSILTQIGFEDADIIYHDCKQINHHNLLNIDYSEIVELVQELNPIQGSDSLAEIGLFN